MGRPAIHLSNVWSLETFRRELNESVEAGLERHLAVRLARRRARWSRNALTKFMSFRARAYLAQGVEP